jgi:hypothetical protein
MAKDEGLRVNFSDDEAASEGREFNPIPNGKYHVKITKLEERESKSEKNAGKPYWAATLVIQDGQYADRRLFANIMLFDGALYTLAQLLKAIGEHDALKSGKVPPAERFIGESIFAIVVKKRDEYKENQEKDANNGVLEAPIFKNEVTGFKPYEEGALAGASATGSSLMP